MSLETKKEHNEYKNNWKKHRLANDLEYRILENCRTRVNDAIRSKAKKSDHTIELLGCTKKEYVKYLEEKFKHGMTWGNYGKLPDGWQIDHIKPCCKFNFIYSEEQKKCFHYTNTQPLWAKENSIKGGRYEI